MHLGFLVWPTHPLRNDLLLEWEVVARFVSKCILVLSMRQTHFVHVCFFLETFGGVVGHCSLDYSSLQNAQRTCGDVLVVVIVWGNVLSVLL